MDNEQVNSILQQLAAIVESQQQQQHQQHQHQQHYQHQQFAQAHVPSSYPVQVAATDAPPLAAPSFLNHIQRLQQLTEEAKLLPAIDQNTSETTPHVQKQPEVLRETEHWHQSGQQNLPKTRPQPQLQHQLSSPAPNSIIEWGPALRFVSRMGAQGDELETAIKKLLYDQRQNEQSWWKGHENLLREIPKKAGDSTSQGTKLDMTDVIEYDRKIYKAQKAMYLHHEQRLRELGIPFFSLSSKYVTAAEDVPPPFGKITPNRLRALQKQMVQYLLDMYE